MCGQLHPYFTIPCGGSTPSFRAVVDPSHDTATTRAHLRRRVQHGTLGRLDNASTHARTVYIKVRKETER